MFQKDLKPKPTKKMEKEELKELVYLIENQMFQQENEVDLIKAYNGYESLKKYVFQKPTEDLTY